MIGSNTRDYKRDTGESLYRRSESHWAIALMLSLLVMLTYLRHFLRRSVWVLLGKLHAPKAKGPPS